MLDKSIKIFMTDTIDIFWALLIEPKANSEQ
jgi:hypothetical protein